MREKHTTDGRTTGVAPDTRTPQRPPADASGLTTADGVLDRLRAGADAFVRVGDRFDPDSRYLTRFHGPDRPSAFVATDERTTLCAPALVAEQARREFAGTRRHKRTPPLVPV